MSSTNHQIRSITDSERHPYIVPAARNMARRCGYGRGPHRCLQEANYCCSYDYMLRGRLVRSDKYLCTHHAAGFSRQHGLSR